MARKVKSPVGSCLNFQFDYVTIEIILIVIVIFVAIYLIYKQRRNFREKYTTSLPTFSMYYTDWCGHSLRMKPVFESVKDAYLGKIDFIKHDCDDKEDGKAQCSRNNIRFLPTLLFRKTPQSEPVKYPGGPNGEVMVEFLNNMLNQ